jgi:hypothetical protein
MVQSKKITTTKLINKYLTNREIENTLYFIYVLVCWACMRVSKPINSVTEIETEINTKSKTETETETKTET